MVHVVKGIACGTFGGGGSDGGIGPSTGPTGWQLKWVPLPWDHRGTRPTYHPPKYALMLGVKYTVVCRDYRPRSWKDSR